MELERQIDDFMTTKEVAATLKVCTRTVLRLASIGRLDARRVPGTRKVLFPRAQFHGVFEKVCK